MKSDFVYGEHLQKSSSLKSNLPSVSIINIPNVLDELKKTFTLVVTLTHLDNTKSETIGI